MNHDRLKERHRAERHAWPENLGLRVHRALSWLHRAEQQTFRAFLQKLAELDAASAGGH